MSTPNTSDTQSLLQICVGAGLHGLGMSACFIASLTLMTETGGKSRSVDQVIATFKQRADLLKLCPIQVAVLTSLWISAENVGSFLGAIGGGAAYDRYRLESKSC